MSVENLSDPAGGGTAAAPHFIDVGSESSHGVQTQSRVFTYQADQGLVGGLTISVAFTVPDSVSAVWPVLKDWNLWENGAGAHYSAVVGDLRPGEKFTLETDPNPNHAPLQELTMVGVVPEQFIAVEQSVPKVPEVGLGLVPAGVHLMTVNDSESEALVRYMGQMQSVMLPAADADEPDIESAVAPWREMLRFLAEAWRDVLIPTLREQVATRAATNDKRGV